jgi:hypothetical protein
VDGFLGVAQFTGGVLFGSRAFVDGWFETNRDFVEGLSRTGRKRAPEVWEKQRSKASIPCVHHGPEVFLEGTA